MSPKRPDLVLTSDIPDAELDVLVCHRLNVEPNGRDSCDGLVQFEFVENSVLVFPAASRPNINNLISLLPKILPKAFERLAPIIAVDCCRFV
jgi:hypothetical protein